MRRIQHFIGILIIAFLLTGCGQSASDIIVNPEDIDIIEIQTVSEEDPHKVIALRPISEKAKVNEIIELVRDIKVRKLLPKEEGKILKNGVSATPLKSYTITFQNSLEKDAKKAILGAMTLFEDGTLIFDDPKTINSGKPSISYIPLNDHAEVGKILLKTVENHLLSENCMKELDYNETQMKYLKDEKDYYKEFIGKVLTYLEDEELKELAQSEWRYYITVNDQEIPPKGQIKVRDKNINICFGQEQPEFHALPSEVFKQGRLNNWLGHIEIEGPEPSKKSETDERTVSEVHYEYKKLSEGTRITINITDEFKERIGIETNEIQIIVE